MRTPAGGWVSGAGAGPLPSTFFNEAFAVCASAGRAAAAARQRPKLNPAAFKRMFRFVMLSLPLAETLAALARGRNASQREDEHGRSNQPRSLRDPRFRLGALEQILRRGNGGER